MKKFILIIASVMLGGAIAFQPLVIRAQEQEQKKNEFLSTWHDVCSKKDASNAERCCQLSQEMTEKYPNLEKQYLDYAKRTEEKCALNKSIENADLAIKSFYATPPDAKKLDALLTAGDKYLEIDQDPQSPLRLYIMAQQCEAGHRSVKAGVYQNLDKVKTYSESALKAYETLDPPEKFKKAYTDYGLYGLRDLVLANMNQYLGYYLLETKGDQPEAQDQALAYIAKSIAVRSKDSKELIGWKDPNNYSLRRSIYSNRYSELRKKYDALTDEQKTGETGKELLKQITQLFDTRLIPELARMIATATNPAYQDLKNDATEDFNNYWKFRVDDTAKARAYLESFVADPTIEGPPVPAKADDGANALAPDVTGDKAKLGAGAPAAPAAGAGKSGTKPRTTTKGGTRRKT